mgnify:CR=1 FL=1
MGLISNAVDPNSAGKNVFSADTATYDPTLRTVNQENETVSSQLDRILGKDSPLVTRARASSTQAMNSRGLVNTAMAGQAGEAAAIDAALPIAAADANVYGTAARENQTFSNTAGQFNAGAKNTSNLNAAAAGNASLGATQAGNIQSGLIGRQAEEARTTQAAGAAQTSALSTQQAGQQLTAQERAALQASALSKQQAGQQLTSQEQAALQQSQLTSQQGEINKQIATLQGQIQTGLIGATGAQTRMTNEQIAQAQQELSKLQASQASQLSAQQATQAGTLATAAQEATKALQAAHDTVLQAMQTADATSKTELANIEADYKTLMQTSATAGDLYKTSMATITSISQDANMDAASKQTAIDNQLNILKSGMNLVGSVNGIDLSGLLPVPA